MKSNINIRILALISAMASGYLLGNLVELAFDGEVKQSQQSITESSKTGYLGWRSRKLLEVNINSEIIQARRSCNFRRGPVRQFITTTPPPTCSIHYDRIMKLPGCSKEVLVKLLNQMRSTTTTDSPPSPAITKSPTAESTEQITTRSNVIHEVNLTTKSSEGIETANQITTSKAQTTSVHQSPDNMTTSGGTTAPLQITNSTDLDMTRSKNETTTMVVPNATLTTESDLGSSNTTTQTSSSLNTASGGGDTDEKAPPSVSTSSTTGTPTTTAINGTESTMTLRTSTIERCPPYQQDTDDTPDEVAQHGCSLACIGFGYCNQPEELKEQVLCNSCIIHCLTNRFKDTERKPCDEICSQKSSCGKRQRSVKKKNIATLPRPCKKCLKRFCDDDERFSNDCDYYSIIENCYQDCPGIDACEFCHKC